MYRTLSFAFVISFYTYTLTIILEIYIVYRSIYLEQILVTNSDPISVCEALRQQNDALRQELHDIRRVCIHIYNVSL